ncbi:MAG: hypothetical protein GWO28_01195 [candidate division Zixibacteria bacterium]|nr:hypothetical protein [candidate division Zixibacteria bacterium]
MEYALKSIGTDPEVFLSEKGDIISAIGLIGGSKDKPLKVDGGALQEDNVLAEFNIQPATSSEQFVRNIRHVMDQLKAKVGPNRELIIKSSHTFTEEFLKAAGPKAMEFGCDPDYDAYLINVNEPPNPASGMRTAGGHVHTCFNVQEPNLDPFKAAIMMDLHLGIPSLLLDDDVERRQMYGKAGACRPKLVEMGDEYDGVEYRSLSNFWLKSDELISWVYDRTEQAVDAINNFDQMLTIVPPAHLQDVINIGDKDAANEIVQTLGIPLPSAA